MAEAANGRQTRGHSGARRLALTGRRALSRRILSWTLVLALVFSALSVTVAATRSPARA